VGDFIPDGPPETACGFGVEQLEPPRLLVLHSTSHLPLEWRSTGKASVDWTWVFTVVPLDSGGRARLIFRWRAATRPWWLTLGTWAVIVPADFLMSRDMLRGVKRRTERPRTNKTLISDHESQLNLSSGSDHITTPNQA
jgi:hypothetical protein